MANYGSNRVLVSDDTPNGATAQSELNFEASTGILTIGATSSLSINSAATLQVTSGSIALMNTGQSHVFLGRGYPTNTTTMGSYRVGLMNANVLSAGGNRFSFFAAENWTDPAQGTFMRYYSTNVGSAVNSTVFEITPAAQFNFGTSTLYPTLTETSRIMVHGRGTTSSTYTAQFHDSTGTSNSLVIRDDGNVGIGVASPLYLLHVEQATNGSGNPVAFIKVLNGDGAILQLQNSEGSTYFSENNNAILIQKGSNYLFYGDSAGNTSIGSATPGARLNIVGSGSTSSTASLLIQNSSSTTLLSVKDDGLVTIPGSATIQGLIQFGLVQFYPVNDGGYTLNSAGRELRSETTITSSVSGAFGYQWGVFSLEQTTSTASFIDAHVLTGSINPTSGTKSYSTVVIKPSYNATGTYAGDIYGVRYSPTLTSMTGVANHHSWYSTSGKAYIATNYNNVGESNSALLVTTSNFTTNLTYGILKVNNSNVQGSVTNLMLSSGAAASTTNRAILGFSTDQGGGNYDTARIQSGYATTNIGVLEFYTTTSGTGSSYRAKFRGGDYILGGIGSDVPAARFHVVGSGATSSTYTAQFHNSAGNSNSLLIRDDGWIGIGSLVSAPVLSASEVTIRRDNLFIRGGTDATATKIWIYSKTNAEQAELSFGDGTEKYKLYKSTGSSPNLKLSVVGVGDMITYDIYGRQLNQLLNYTAASSNDYAFKYSGTLTGTSNTSDQIPYFYVNPVLVAGANSQGLVAFKIQPTFTNGAYTGVANYALHIVSGGIRAGYSSASSYSFSTTEYSFLNQHFQVQSTTDQNLYLSDGGSSNYQRIHWIKSRTTTWTLTNTAASVPNLALQYNPNSPSGMTINVVRDSGIGIGSSGTLVTPSASLHVVGAGSTSSTWTAQFHNSTGSSNSLMIRDDGSIGIGTSSPSSVYMYREFDAVRGIFLYGPLAKRGKRRLREDCYK